MNLFLKNQLRIAHISDLHFSKISLNPSQFLSKRWVGNLNLLFFRKDLLVKDHIYSLPELFEELKIDLVLISGDFTSTSRKTEFKLAQNFTNSIQKKNIPIITLPGNHDHYTKKSFRKKIFYRFFPNKLLQTPSFFDQFNLKDHQVEIHPLTETWWTICLDTASPTSLFSSEGFFSEELERRLDKILLKVPRNISLILMNHFPFFQNDKKKNRMRRGLSLQQLLLKHPNVKLYLHGHTHRKCVADLRASGLPIILDPGSVGDFKKASWNLIDLKKESFGLKSYSFKENWDVRSESHFTW